MKQLRLFLVMTTVLIYAITVIAILNKDIYWPVVYFGDLLQLDWRTQFNTDFLIHLLLLATWIVWREGASTKGYAYGFLSIFMGGMFGFPYILYATYAAKGDPKAVLLGVHAR